MVLPSLTKSILEELKFSNWYKELSDNHQPISLFSDVDIDEAQDMICEFGYNEATFIPAAYFYSVEDVEDGVTGLSLSLKGGRMELMLTFEQHGKTRASASFSSLCEKLGHKGKIQSPAFSNYKELYALLKNVFDMYEFIKEKMEAATEKNTTMLSFVRE